MSTTSVSMPPIGPHSTVYPTSSVRGTIPPAHIYKNEKTILPKV